MLTRDITQTCKRLSESFPILTIMGPRQAGKTTLARQLFADKPYINLENPELRQWALDDPVELLNEYPEGCVFDEIQHAPQLLSYLQVRVDNNRTPGQYVITGSQNFQLSQAISQSLAGRAGVLTLLPLSLHECMLQPNPPSLETCLIEGGYPGLHTQPQIQVGDFFNSYIQTYLERDVRTIGNLSLFRKFVQCLAGRCAGILNKESLGNDLGVSGKTIESWLSILEASYIIVRLQPFFETTNKRLIKSPKIYFVDVGLACHLLGIHQNHHLQNHPLQGSLFENLIVMETMKHFHNQGQQPKVYFYRDKRHEVDLIIDRGHHYLPIEIKASHTYHRHFHKNTRYFQSLYTVERVPETWVIYQGEHSRRQGPHRLFHASQFPQALRQLQH